MRVRNCFWVSIALLGGVSCNLVKNKNKATLSIDSASAVTDDSADAEAAPAAPVASVENVAETKAVLETPVEVASPTPVSQTPAPLPQTLKELGLSEDGKLVVKAGHIPYGVEAPLWSDGAFKERYIALPEGKSLAIDPSNNRFVFPSGTMLIKHFAAKADGSLPVETRVMLLLEDNSWAFASYQWGRDGTQKRVTAVTNLEVSSDWPSGYRIPSEDECVKCHKAAPSEVLGFQPTQITGTVSKLVAAKILNEDLSKKILAVVPQPDPADSTLPIKTRALAYLNVNCAPCHRPAGTNSYLQLDSEHINLDWLLLKKYIVPGKPEESTLYKRFVAEKNRMPQVSVVQDPLGLELLKAWITQYNDLQ